MRPNVVWFGEDLPHDVWVEAETASRNADIMFSIGTSAQVYPAAGLPSLAKEYGAYVVEVNPDTTDFTSQAHAHLRGPSGIILPMLIAELTL
jgi:NAD-dependent deacetylase